MGHKGDEAPGWCPNTGCTLAETSRRMPGVDPRLRCVFLVQKSRRSNSQGLAIVAGGCVVARLLSGGASASSCFKPHYSLVPFVAQTGGVPETLRRRCSSQPSVSAPPAASRTSGSAKCGLAARHPNSIPIPRFSTLPKPFPPSFQPFEVSITPCLTNSLR